MPDGRLDFDDDVLAQFDIVLASLHDGAGHGAGRLLDRYLRAIDHPFVNVITHPANRTPGGHPGYDLDFDRLFEAAARSGTAVEVDGSPNHLDLDGALARRAAACGAMLTIDSDAHRHDLLGRQLEFGVGTARRGWVQPEQVLNTRGASAVRAFVAAKRRAASQPKPRGRSCPRPVGRVNVGDATPGRRSHSMLRLALQGAALLALAGAYAGAARAQAP